MRRSDSSQIRKPAASNHAAAWSSITGSSPGAERDFESLLRAWCAQLKEQGLDTLTIFTSDASPGSGLLSSLAAASESFVVWTPGIAEPPSAAMYGIYVDSIYF